jgi:hypothetical protein
VETILGNSLVVGGLTSSFDFLFASFFALFAAFFEAFSSFFSFSILS